MGLREQIEKAEKQLEDLEKEKLLTISSGLGGMLDITTRKIEKGLRQAFFLLFGIIGVLSLLLSVLACTFAF